MKKTLGQVISTQRELHSWSQRDLAKNTGVSNSTISRLEKDETEAPDPQTLRKIAECLNIDYYYLMSLSGHTDDTAELRAIRKVMKQMTEKEKEKMMAILNASFDDRFKEVIGEEYE